MEKWVPVHGAMVHQEEAGTPWDVLGTLLGSVWALPADRGLASRAFARMANSGLRFALRVLMRRGLQRRVHLHGGVYLAIVGGAAALETEQIEEIEQVWWEDLMPECLWKFRVKNFGPLIVAIDAHGNSLYKDVKAAAAERIKAMNL